MAIDLQDEGRNAGVLRGIFDHEQLLDTPSRDDLLARSEIALAEFIRGLRRTEDRLIAEAGRARWNGAFVKGYAEGRAVGARPVRLDRPLRASEVLPARTGVVCGWCRAAVAGEVSGFDMTQDEVARALGDEQMLDDLARQLGADIPGHRCQARDGLSTCACGCSIWRDRGR